MAAQERHLGPALLGIQLSIEASVQGLSHGQANRLRTRIWNSMVVHGVNGAKGIENTIKFYTKPINRFPPPEPQPANVYPIPAKARIKLAQARQRIG